MVCKKCGCDSWHLKEFYWRCVNCNCIRKAPGVTIKILKERVKIAEGKELRDINYLLSRRKSGK